MPSRRALRRRSIETWRLKRRPATKRAQRAKEGRAQIRLKNLQTIR